MMDLDGPLDFENEDPLLDSPVLPKRRSKKVIGLDDLLSDYYKEKSKVIEKESKRAKTRRNYDSDEEDMGKEALLSRKINECHNQMKAMGGEEENSSWGLRVFGGQGTPLPVVFPEHGCCSLLQSFTSHKQKSLVELTEETEKSFLEELLLNGWLLNLVSAGHHVDNLIAEWTFNLMLYSSKEGLVKSSCEFWCAILSSENKVDKLSPKIDWFPNYACLKRALQIYGFCFNFSADLKPECRNHDGNEPPKNIRSWIKLVTTCFCTRNRHFIFSASETEELVAIIIFLCLDRQLQGMHALLHECLQSAINYFTDEEWSTSSEKMAKALAHRVPKDLNCLRSVDCIFGVSSRSNHLRSAISYEILCICLENEACCEEEILNLLISINLKEKSCDLFKVYIYLILTENWLLSNPNLEEKRVICEMWGVYLRNCSCQITSTDLRPYASKVRTKASYLLNGNMI